MDEPDVPLSRASSQPRDPDPTAGHGRRREEVGGVRGVRFDRVGAAGVALARSDGERPPGVRVEFGLDAEGGQLASYWMEVDGQFIAHAREDVPAMAAEIRRLRAQLNAVTTLCDEQEMAAHLFEFPTPEWITAVRRAVEDATEETHVVADDSDDPEHVDDCPGCTAAHPST